MRLTPGGKSHRLVYFRRRREGSGRFKPKADRRSDHTQKDSFQQAVPKGGLPIYTFSPALLNRTCQGIGKTLVQNVQVRQTFTNRPRARGHPAIELLSAEITGDLLGSWK